MVFSQYLHLILPVQYWGEAQIEITDLYNSLGQKLVKIQMNGDVVENQTKSDMHLDLYFGPPSIAALDKITGYELVQNNSDSAYFQPISY